MRAIITVIGKDSVGILSKVSGTCSDLGVNIAEVSQSVLQDMFAMIMLVEIENTSVSIDSLNKELQNVAETSNTKIHVMHEDIFNSMHKI